MVSIKTAPLRERREDIPVLASYFVDQACHKYGMRKKGITPQAMDILESYDWPGNIRELKNFIEGLVAVIPANRRIRSIDLEEIKNGRGGSCTDESEVLQQLLSLSYEEAKKSFERYYFEHLLKKNNGNVTHSARCAKIHPATLHRKVNQLQMRA